jgi:hypothetical protein
MAKRHHSGEIYASHDERRKLEARDGGMLSEDHTAIANLPQGVIMREYPKIHGYSPEGLDDTERGIEHQVNLDNSKKMSHLDPKKV